MGRQPAQTSWRIRAGKRSRRNRANLFLKIPFEKTCSPESVISRYSSARLILSCARGSAAPLPAATGPACVRR